MKNVTRQMVNATGIDTESLILGIETATRGGGVCVARGKTILATRIGDPAVSHSTRLLEDIEACLQEAGIKLEEVKLFAAASGPGSFTGLRIGLATVKALSNTLSRPCLGIPTLHAVAHSAGQSKATIAVLPAGRGEVFVQRLLVLADAVIELDKPAHRSPLNMLDFYGSLPDLTWSGEGAHVQRHLIAEYAQEKGIEFTEAEVAKKKQHGWTLAPKEENLSKSITSLAFRRFQSGEEIGPHALNAIYVRPSDAELKWP